MAKNPAAVALGRLGGAATKGVTSRKKAAAARRNGKKGGRPRMAPTPLQAQSGDSQIEARQPSNKKK